MRRWHSIAHHLRSEVGRTYVERTEICHLPVTGGVAHNRPLQCIVSSSILPDHGLFEHDGRHVRLRSLQFVQVGLKWFVEMLRQLVDDERAVGDLLAVQLDERLLSFRRSAGDGCNILCKKVVYKYRNS